jgi:hypothetical protein
MAKKGLTLIKDDPEPTGKKTFIVVTRMKINARCKRWVNAQGKAIMAVYPKDNAPVSSRVQFKPGTTLEVYQEIVTADGGGQYRAIKGSYILHKPYTLYVNVSNVKKTG